MNARELLKAGKLNEAVQALGAEVRDNPTDAQRRTFLFELLCFAGDYERANKHLELIGEGSVQVQMGALLYRGALQIPVG
jgi:type VI secretion system protein ImpE